MKLVVFGLTITSSWGNGHATLWRGLCRALGHLGVETIFFEKDVPYYADNRDRTEVEGARIVLYRNWLEVLPRVRAELADADAAIVTSFCPDAVAATQEIEEAPRPVSIFYDLDTPVTLAAIARGAEVPYVPARGLGMFDLVLSYTGGGALDALRQQFGARRVHALYGHVDPATHRPADPLPHYRADLSYLGTFSADRQTALQSLFIEPARLLPQARFVLGGAQYPADFPWTGNIHFVRHLPPAEHPAFFSSGRLTLNVTRTAMAEMGWCPSGRLFEAAACGAAMISDSWEGLSTFFAPESEILEARTTADVKAALDLSDAELRRIGAAARERVLTEHTSEHRAREFLAILSNVAETETARPDIEVEA